VGSVKLSGSWTSEEIAHLKLNYSIEIVEQSNLILEKSVNQISLRSERGHHLEFDFDNNNVDYHRRGSRSSDPLIKALGYSKGIRSVIDLTMGLAIDSVFLAQNGFSVISIERQPLLHLLACEAQKQSKRKEVQSIEFVLSSAQDFLSQNNNVEMTAAYFDPMFPHKKKSALPRQEMVFFRELVGEDEDSVETLKLALSKKFERVVVKRPLKAEPLVGQVSYSIETKLMRFDVYKRTEKQ
jgi:16S rRNA (guanine1516-N2)-methyltransferase